MADAAEQRELFDQAVAPEPEVSTEPTTPEPTSSTPQPVGGGSVGDENFVPSWRLREEAEARRLSDDRARQLEARLNEVAAHLQQQQKPPDFFADPNKATEALVLRALQPIIEESRRSAEESRQAMMHMGRMIAKNSYGDELVDQAEQAFLKAHSNKSLDIMDYEKVVQAPNRYAACVEWYRNQNVLSSVGHDPAAWFEKQLEQRMADPTFQAKMLEKMRGGAAARPGTVKLPPSLSRATAAAGNSAQDGDMSDQSLFAFAMNAGRDR